MMLLTRIATSSKASSQIFGFNRNRRIEVSCGVVGFVKAVIVSEVGTAQQHLANANDASAGYLAHASKCLHE